MLFFLFAFYALYRSGEALKPYLYNVVEDNVLDSTSLINCDLLTSVYSYGSHGQFTIANPTKDSVIFYVYDILSRSIKKIYRTEPVINIKQDIKFYVDKGIFVNDSLLLIIGLSSDFDNNYILYINPLDKNIKKIHPIPPGEIIPFMCAFSKKNNLLAFGIYGFEKSECGPIIKRNDCGEIYLLNVKTEEIKKILEGYVYPETWLDDSLLLIIDAGDCIQRYLSQFLSKRPITVESTRDFLIYNINTYTVTKLKDDTKSKWVYRDRNEIYFVETHKDYENIIVTLIVRDSEGNSVICRMITPSIYPRDPIFIPYPED